MIAWGGTSGFVSHGKVNLRYTNNEQPEERAILELLRDVPARESM
jgi:hypothetical protein